MNVSRTGSSARRTLAASIVALTFASIAYRVLMAGGVEHSSLVFIGIPALLALALTAVQPKTSAGTVHKATAVALCLSGILFGEGFICILMASPLFFLVAGVTEKLTRRARQMEEAALEGAQPEITRKTLGAIVLLPLALEGVIPHYEMSRDEVVTVSRVVAASSSAVRTALASPMQFERELPLFFKLGFPTPGTTDGEGLEVGDRRTVEFIHGGHHPGTLVLHVTSSEPARVVFTPVADDSYLTHWLAWRSAEVSWEGVSPTETRVTWTLRYRRRLDPSWYFAPLERYGVGLAATYLIETLATPRTSGSGTTSSAEATP